MVTTDLVVVKGCDILLIKRGHDPYQGSWALPGGFVEKNEDLPDAAARELFEETGVSDLRLRQIGAFGKPGRDPRGHTITVAYYSEIPVDKEIYVRAGDDAAEAEWFSIYSLPDLAFDHRDIIKAGLIKFFNY